MKTTDQLDRTNPDTWPFILGTKEVKFILGVGMNKTLEIFHRHDFPRINYLGSSLKTTKPALLEWLNKQTNTELKRAS